MNWCYIACFIDTDGFVGFIVQKGQYYSKQVRVAFYNDDKNVLEIMKEFLQCKSNVKPRKNPKGGVTWYLQIQERNLVKQIIENCLPYLIVKRKLALECFEYILSK